MELSKANLQLTSKAKSTYAQLLDIKDTMEKLRKERPSAAPEVTDNIEKYAKFFLHRIEDVPRLSHVFRDRGNMVSSFGKLIGERDYASALLGTLQTLCDFIVAEGERSRHAGDKAVQTSAARSEMKPEAELKATRSDRELVKIMNESDQLLASISMQSQRIANLNSQLYSTISPQSTKASAQRLDHYRGGTKKEQGRARGVVSGKSSPTGGPKVLKLEEWEDVTWKRQSPSPRPH